MLAAGWVDEVRQLLARGVPGDAKPFQFIGYGELREHLAGKMSLDEAAAAIQQATRRYAKRQLTWFRRETGVKWLEGFGDEPRIASASLGYLQEQLLLASAVRAPLTEGV